MSSKLTPLLAAAAVMGLGLAGPAQAADSIPVGHLSAFTGPTSDVGVPYGNAIDDAVAYINAHGGINGKKIDMPSEDYGYEIPRSVAHYKRWQSSLKPVLIQGWGTSDTEALTPFVTKDGIVFFSASYSGHLTDPTGKAPRSKAATPYNFFVGATYSDACRAQASWAMKDWKASGKEGKPKWVHMGANHPYPNAPKEACTEWAEEIGFDVLPPIVYPLAPADFKSQCLALKDAGVNYAYLGNTAASNVSMIKSCKTVGTDVQFVTNYWGFDEPSAEAAGADGDGIVVPAMAAWTSDAPGMKTVHEVSKMSDPEGKKARALPYIRGVCSAFVMRDAMLLADKSGEVTSQSIKAALETMTEHVPAELQGVCPPVTWTPTDHRATTQVTMYRNNWNNGNPQFEMLDIEQLPRGEEYLGW
ncbi:ABC transporter substrate-binding protein [Castellaniella sp.]|uniref:ABC transporter substrate-binding protein n=2 Tax=Castellaniella sp. TaxID=1955812 RepID=UPI00356B4156